MGRPLRENMRGDWEPTFDTDGPELLPCPFCGGAAYYLKPTVTKYVPKMDCKPQASEYPTYQVECIDCGAHSVPAIMHLGCTPAEGKQAAAGRWNRRAELGVEVTP